MWVLQLNPMTANAEQVIPVVYAETREQLEAFLTSETVEPYQDGPWGKVFRQGSLLEWFNPPYGENAFMNVPAFVDIGSAEDWAMQAIKRYHDLLNEIPHI